MNKLWLFALILIYLPLHAQIDETIPPKSLTTTTLPFEDAQEINLSAFSIANSLKEDLTDAKQGKLPRFSRSIKVNLNPDNSGTWTKLPDGSSVWRIHIRSKGALGLVPVFDELFIPPGGTLHIYTKDKVEMIGAFTHANTITPRGFCTGLIHGESCTIEYYEPSDQSGRGSLKLESIGHAYRWIKPYNLQSCNRSADTCQVNINCQEGSAYQDQKRAVVLMLIVDNLGQGFCTGTMINNARNDCTPYLLTAQHCGEFSSTANFSQWVFYYNYESANCNGTSGSLLRFVNGCTKIADSDDQGGETGSDFMLLKLNTPPPSNYNSFLAGWDRNEIIPDNSVCIHHPQNDIKKISTSLTPPEIVSWGNIKDSTHWDVLWEPTTNGHGVTEEGSSGAALFNNEGNIIGTLTGGASACDYPWAVDQFGRFAYHWKSNGNTNIRQLQPWLDPDNTGALSVAGINFSCSTGLGKNEVLLNKLFIFPNPASKYVNIRFDNEKENLIRLSDACGRKIHEIAVSQKVMTLDISFLSPGIYLIEAQDTDGIIVQKLIVN